MTHKNAVILDGRKLAESLKLDLMRELSDLKAQTGKVPILKNIMIGEDPGTCAYANAQKRVATSIGIGYDLITLAQDISQQDLVDVIQNLDADPDVNGIMIHKPVPDHIDYNHVANHVDTAKDLEGINVANIGKMILGETRLIPCTPASVMAHIHSTGLPLRGKEAVIVGHSEIVGKPLSLLLLDQMATVTVCHVATSEAGRLQDHVSRADILIVAVGKPHLIPGAWIKDGATVVDVGINRLGDRIVGDVDFDEARSRAGFITPVPGGVGPVTVLMLMRNGIEAFKAQNQVRESIKT